MIRRSLLNALSRASLSQRALSMYDRVFNIARTSRFVSDETYSSSSKKSVNILFPYPQGGKQDHIYKYCVLAKAFEIRGFNSMFVLCDQVLPACQMKDVASSKHCASCNLCHYRGIQLLDSLGLNWVPISKLIGDNDIYNEVELADIDTNDYRGVNLEKFANASVRRVDKLYHLDSESSKAKIEQFLRAGMLLVDAFEDALQRYDVQVIISQEDKYCWSGIPLVVGENNNIQSYSTGVNWINDDIIMSRISHRESFPLFEEIDMLNKFLEEPLSQDQENKINDLMNGSRPWEEGYDSHSNNNASLFGTNADDTTIAMFTNLVWDASLEIEDAVFPDMFNWIESTINLYTNLSNTNLIVKTHPSEETFATNESVTGWIRSNYKESELQNISIIEPAANIKTRDLLQQIDGAIVYNTTVGLEAAYDGVPTIVGGRTHYQDLGITFDPTDMTEYFNLLKSISDIEMSRERTIRAKRYAYFFFIAKRLQFDYFPESFDPEDFEPINVIDLEPGNETFDQIVNRTIEGSPVLSKDLNSLIK